MQSWATLQYQYTGSDMLTVTINGSSGYMGHALQLRQVGDVAKVTCGGQTLSKTPPPPLGEYGDIDDVRSSTSGWWVVPASDDSLWQAAGSVVINLPRSVPTGPATGDGMDAAPGLIVVVSF